MWFHTISKYVPFFASKLKFTPTIFGHRRINKFSNTADSFKVNTNVIKDVILYKYDNPKFFKILNVFAICQFGFWGYLSVTAYTTLRDAPVSKSKDAAWWQKINLGENKYKNIIAASAFIIGKYK